MKSQERDTVRVTTSEHVHITPERHTLSYRAGIIENVRIFLRKIILV